MSSKVAIPDDSIEYLLTRNDRTVRKKFLSRIYSEWAQLLLDYCGPTGLSIEIGASNPIVKRLLDRENVLGLDVVYSPMIALQGDATNLPFTQNSVSNFLSIDTLHHLPDAQLFFSEVSRTLVENGRLVLIEPWSNQWSRFIYRRLHTEPFLPTADWKTVGDGPMTRANLALPWIVLDRDRELFRDRFRELRIVSINPLMPLSYVVSGGARLNFGLPGFLFPIFRRIEQFFEHRGIGLSALIVIEKSYEA